MKKLLLAVLFGSTLPLAYAAQPSPDTLTNVYRTQVKALAADDRATLASTIDESTCRDIQQVVQPFFEKKDADTRMFLTLFGLGGAEVKGLAPCDVMAQLALGLYKTARQQTASLAPEKVTLLGVVEDGSDRAYGVFRTTTDVSGTPFTTETLVVFSNNGPHWKVTGDSGLKALATQMKAISARQAQ